MLPPCGRSGKVNWGQAGHRLRSVRRKIVKVAELTLDISVLFAGKGHTLSCIVVWSVLCCYCSVAQPCPTLRPHESQHTRPPCLSPTPRVCSNSCPLSQWCHPTIASSVVPFSSCLQSFPASGSFPVSQFFASGGPRIRASASASGLPMNIQDWFPLGWTGLISLLSKGLSRVFSNTTVWKHQFFSTQPSLWSNSQECVSFTFLICRHNDIYRTQLILFPLFSAFFRIRASCLFHLQNRKKSARFTLIHTKVCVTVVLFYNYTAAI